MPRILQGTHECFRGTASPIRRANPQPKIDLKQLDLGLTARWGPRDWDPPPERQAEMRAAGWWSILWDSVVVELPHSWVIDLPIFKEKIAHWEWPQLFDRLSLVDIPFERYVAGGILQRLNAAFGPARGAAFPQRAPDARDLDKELQAGVQDGLEGLAADLRADAQLVARLLDAGFDVRKALG